MAYRSVRFGGISPRITLASSEEHPLDLFPVCGPEWEIERFPPPDPHNPPSGYYMLVIHYSITETTPTISEAWLPDTPVLHVKCSLSHQEQSSFPMVDVSTPQVCHDDITLPKLMQPAGHAHWLGGQEVTCLRGLSKTYFRGLGDKL